MQNITNRTEQLVPCFRWCLPCHILPAALELVVLHCGVLGVMRVGVLASAVAVVAWQWMCWC